MKTLYESILDDEDVLVKDTKEYSNNPFLIIRALFNEYGLNEIKHKMDYIDKILKPIKDQFMKYTKIKKNGLRFDLDNFYTSNNSYSLKFYTFHDGEYTIVIPKCAVDLVEEGRALHHCVGTYSEKFDKGNSDIIFIRRIDQIEKSLLTMEIVKEKKGFRVVQCYGFKDDRPLGGEDAWMREDYQAWLDIYQRSVRDFVKKFEKYLETKGEEEHGKRARVG